MHHRFLNPGECKVVSKVSDGESVSRLAQNVLVMDGLLENSPKLMNLYIKERPESTSLV